ncbi:MAG: diaminopimelate decarboxylase, partial [Desulfobulbia bacterium]
MHHFQYKSGILHAEDVNLADLAKKVGTPFYCYSTATLERHFRVFADAVSEIESLICFAIKSNSNLSIIKLLANLGSGMDVVSGGELRRARLAGVPGNKIIFSGVGKSESEMMLGLGENILCFNVESESELERLNSIALSRNQIAPISLRINPDVDPKTHAKISTGKAEDKFGIPYKQARQLYKRASVLKGLEITGVDMHIGSQIIELVPFGDAFDLLRELVLDLRTDGHDIRHIDVGGGLGIPYQESSNDIPHPIDYARLVKAKLGDLNCRLLFEPGRMIAGNAGILVTSVLHVKSNGQKIFTVVDAAMNDLMRPTLYDAYH